MLDGEVADATARVASGIPELSPGLAECEAGEILRTFLKARR
jgi:hypothetical protein